MYGGIGLIISMLTVGVAGLFGYSVASITSAAIAQGVYTTSLVIGVGLMLVYGTLGILSEIGEFFGGVLDSVFSGLESLFGLDSDPSGIGDDFSFKGAGMWIAGIWFTGYGAFGLVLTGMGFPALISSFGAATAPVVIIAISWKLFLSKITDTTLVLREGDLIGREGVVTIEITPESVGEIRIDDSTTGVLPKTAISTETMKVNELVRVISITGGICKVERI